MSHMPGLGKSSYAKKRRAKRLQVYHKYARWNCNTQCRSLGMISENREDKIRFIKNELSRESLDNILLTLETHSYGLVQLHNSLNLWNIFYTEHSRYSLGESDFKRPCLPVYKKTGWESDPRLIKGVETVSGRKTRGRCEPQS